MGVVTTRLVIICIPAAYRLVNDTLDKVDPTSSGDNITVPLRLASNLTGPNDAAFGGSWAMDDATRNAINSAVRDAGWSPRPTNAERTLYGPADTPPSLTSGQRVWLFNGMAMSFDDALGKLGLARPYYE